MPDLGYWQELTPRDMFTETEEMLGLGEGFFTFSIWATYFDTCDESSAFRDFLMDPLAFIHPRGDRSRDSNLVLAPLAEADDLGWKVVTKINNHHRKLNPRIVFGIAFVDGESPTVHLTLHKQEGKC